MAIINWAGSWISIFKDFLHPCSDFHAHRSGAKKPGIVVVSEAGFPKGQVGLDSGLSQPRLGLGS